MAGFAPAAALQAVPSTAAMPGFAPRTLESNEDLASVAGSNADELPPLPPGPPPPDHFATAAASAAAAPPLPPLPASAPATQSAARDEMREMRRGDMVVMLP